MYNTFREKMQNVSITPAIRLSPSINIFQLASQLKGTESFDRAEVTERNASGLVRVEAILEGNKWFENDVYPLIYADYPLLGWMKIGRPDPLRLGIPPVRDVFIENAATSDEVLVYNLGPPVASDYYDMQRHAVNYLVDHPDAMIPRLEALVIRPLPYLRYGNYRLRFQYYIPGIDKITSHYDVEMFNRIPDND